MCDSYIRRNEGQERVIGTLLGRCACRLGSAARRRAGSSRSETLVLVTRSVTDGAVEIKNSYAVPHNESNGQARAASGAPQRRTAPYSALRSAQP